VPVVECQEHGSQTVQVPWSEGKSRFTLFFERLAIEVLQACTAKKASELLDISWDEADGIKQRAVRRGMARRTLEGLEYVCVDEKAVGLGHDYVTVVTGIIDCKPQVLYVGDGKGEEGLNGFWNLIGPEGCQRIKAISMDMGKSYQLSARRYCPQAELVFDPFHIMKMLNKAVDSVRRQEAIMGTGEERSSLKKTRQLWLWGQENLPQCHAARFEELKQSTLKTARAWRLKELWRTFKQCINVRDAMAFFQKWYALAMGSKLEPIKAVARTMKAHLPGIVSIFTHGFCNAMAEGVNSRIQLLVQKSCGYRNRERLKTDILFHFGGLNLNPLPAQ
jgi:transposase